MISNHSSELPLLTLAVIDNWPFIGIQATDDDEVVSASGIDYEILKTLADVLQFRYRIIKCPYTEWGDRLPNGEISGLIGMVARREIDLAINEITILATREEIIDFSHTYYTEITVLTSKSPSVLRSPFAVFLPFTVGVWCMIALSTLCVGIVMTLMFKLDRIQRPFEKSLRTKDVLFNSFRTLVVQANRFKVQKLPMQFLFWIWYVTCFLIYALYAGTLTGFLIVPSYETPINTLDDLLVATRAGEAVPIMLKDTSVHYLFEDAESGLYKDLYEVFDPERSYLPDVRTALHKVLEYNGVLLHSSLSAEVQATLIGRGKFHQGTGRHYMQNYGIAFPENSPWKARIDKIIPYLLASGLIEKWRMDALNTLEGASLDVPTERTSAVSLSLLHLQGAFFLYFIGVAVSAGVLCLEILCKRCQNSQ